jgi:hypothetical protein
MNKTKQPRTDETKGVMNAMLACVAIVLFCPWLHGADAAFYKLNIVAQTGVNSLSNINKEVSINDLGRVAFIGGTNELRDAFKTIWISDGDGTPARSIFRAGDFNSRVRDFTFPQINNKNLIVAADRFSGVPPVYRIRVWNSDLLSSFAIISEATNFNSLTVPSISNDGSISYVEVKDGYPTTNRLELYQGGTSDVASYGDPLNTNALPPFSMVADGGRVVLRPRAVASEDKVDDPVILFDNLTKVTIADSTRFSATGQLPGISDDGQIVAFAASDGSGQGIFVSVESAGIRKIKRIASVADGFSAFVFDTRVGVSSFSGVPKTATVVYGAFRNSRKGIYSSKLQQTPAGDLVVHPFFLVAEEGMQIFEDSVNQNGVFEPALGERGLAGTVSKLFFYDPVNINGEIVFWVKTSTEEEAVILARQIDLTVHDPFSEDIIEPKLRPSVLQISQEIPALQGTRRNSALLLKIKDKPLTTFRVFIDNPTRLSGSHNHGTAARPHGWIKLANWQNDPVRHGEPGFQEGGTLEYSTYANSVPIVTDIAGNARFCYVAPEISGEEKITVSTEHPVPSQRVVRELTVKTELSGLIRLSANPNIDEKPPLASHPEHYYVTPVFSTALSALALNYSSETPRGTLPTLQLGANDMSLPTGGMFDFDTGHEWHPPHIGHRFGIEADIRVVPDNVTFDEMLDKQGWWTPIKHYVHPHYHLVLSGDGKVYMKDLPANVSAWDPVTREIEVTIRQANHGGIDATDVFVEEIKATAGVVIIGPMTPVNLGLAPIRTEQSFAVRARVPPGVKKFFIQWRGSAASDFRFFAFPESVDFFSKKVAIPPGPLPSPFLPELISAADLSSEARPSFGVVLTNAHQSALPGSTVVFGGLILNSSASSLEIQDLSLNFFAGADREKFECSFASELLATGGVISPGGYFGPIIRVRCLSPPGVGTTALGFVTLMPEFAPDPECCSVSFTVDYQIQALRIAQAGTNIVISWPASGSNFVLESSESLGEFEQEWLKNWAHIDQTGQFNQVLIPNLKRQMFYRLRSVENERSDIFVDLRDESISAEGRLLISHLTDTNSYYILYRGTNYPEVTLPVDIEFGNGGTIALVDSKPLPDAASSYYRIRQVRLDQPEDTDGDGFDDVFEAENRPFLDPLNPTDQLAPAVSVMEGDVGSARMLLLAGLASPSAETTVVRFATADGTARGADNDYVATNGTVQFLPGETRKAIVLSVIGDRRIESNEVFYLNLGVVSGSPWAALVVTQVVCTIVNDDSPAGTIAGLVSLEATASTALTPLECCGGVSDSDAKSLVLTNQLAGGSEHIRVDGRSAARQLYASASAEAFPGRLAVQTWIDAEYPGAGYPQNSAMNMARYSIALRPVTTTVPAGANCTLKVRFHISGIFGWFLDHIQRSLSYPSHLTAHWTFQVNGGVLASRDYEDRLLWDGNTNLSRFPTEGGETVEILIPVKNGQLFTNRVTLETSLFAQRVFPTSPEGGTLLGLAGFWPGAYWDGAALYDADSNVIQDFTIESPALIDWRQSLKPPDQPPVDSYLPPVPLSLAIQPTAVILTNITQKAALAVTGTYSNGATADLTAPASWTVYKSYDGTIATVDRNGIITARKQGQTVVRAENQGAVRSVLVTVSTSAPPRTVTGQVLHRDGHPAADATVTVIESLQATATDANGLFQIANVPRIANVPSGAIQTVTVMAVWQTNALRGFRQSATSPTASAAGTGSLNFGPIVLNTHFDLRLAQIFARDIEDDFNPALPDGLPSGWELLFGYDPTVSDTDHNEIGDRAEDPDEDGLINLQEYANGTDPFSYDSDGDLWDDRIEVLMGSDPCLSNSIPRRFDVASPQITMFLTGSVTGSTVPPPPSQRLVLGRPPVTTFQAAIPVGNLLPPQPGQQLVPSKPPITIFGTTVPAGTTTAPDKQLIVARPPITVSTNSP